MIFSGFSDWISSSSSRHLTITKVWFLVLILGCMISTVLARRHPNAGKDENANAIQMTLAAATALFATYWFTSGSEDNQKDTIAKNGFPKNLDKSLTWREDGGISKLVPIHPVSRSSASSSGDTNKKKGELKKYTMKEVARRNGRDEAWIIIDDLVYDITTFAARHPGGDLVLWNMAGKDCSDVFANYHSARIYKTWLPPYLVGEVTDVPKYPHVQDFRNIRQELLRRGLFETSSSFYYKMFTWYACLLGSALYLSLACQSTLAHMAGAVMLGFFWQQLAGWGHDLGHSSVTHNFTHDNYIGATIGCALMGISTGWWKRSHNTHHVVCNSIENDPDIQHMPVLAVTEKILEKPFWSSYHSKVVSVDAASRFIIRHQHLFFPVIMAFARFNLYAQSWILILTTTNKDSVIMYFRTQETVALLFFATWVLAVALSMPTWTETVAWVLISHGFTALLHIQICLSHFCMETYHGNAYNDASDEWYTMQIKTSLNVDCPEWFDFFHIGLQHQVEHHLYPTLPRHNLRIARKMVKEVCHKHDIPYHEQTFFEGVRRTYVALRDTAMKARSGKYDAQSTEKIRDLLNANG